MPKSITIEIAGVSIAIECAAGLNDWDIDTAYQPFISSRKADIHLRMLHGNPAIAGSTQAFDSSPIWTLYRQGGASTFKIFDNLEDKRRILVHDPDARTAKLYFPNLDGDFVDPFFGPALELLVIQYLARGRGMIMHACGVDNNGQGMMFVGESGAGKSTISNLWCQQNGAEIYSDDRIILRKKDGEYYMYGTPWHGETRFVASRGTKLKHIFFLRQAQNNAARTVNRADAVVEFLKASFPPFWESRGVEFAMTFLSDLADTMPCETLSFKPDASIVDFVKSSLKNNIISYGIN